jgi:nicotinamidase-related amidase
MPAPLLVVIDMQDVFRAAESSWSTPSFQDAADGIDRLLGAFGDRVAFTRFVPPPDHEGSWGIYYDTFADVLRPDRDWFELSEPYRSRVAVTGLEPVTRPTFSAWGERLRELAGEPATLILCGVATDCCVISTALDAVDDGAFVRIAADACGGSSPASHDAAITVMRGYAPQIEISTVERELGALLGGSAAPA